MMSRGVKKIALFLGITFIVDWSLVSLFLVLGGKLDGEGMTILGAVYMIVPMLAAIIIQKVIFKEALVKPLGISFKINRWFFIAWLMPLVLAFAIFGVGLLLPGTGYTSEKLDLIRQQLPGLPVHPLLFIIVLTLIAGTTINAILGFGEELGWRGLLQKEFSLLGFWKSSALIGFIWGVWHAPLILLGLNYPQHPEWGVLLMILWTVAIAPLFSYIRLKSSSVIASSIFHGSINATPGLIILMTMGGNDLTVGITGLAGFIVILIADAAIFLFDRFITKEPVNNILRNI
jgi:uncharacterized protein